MPNENNEDQSVSKDQYDALARRVDTLNTELTDLRNKVQSGFAPDGSATLSKNEVEWVRNVLSKFHVGEQPPLPAPDPNAQ